MTPEEVTTVLAMVAVAESKPVDTVMVSFWLNTLGVHRVTADEFRRAVITHYATSTYPIRPGHVWQIIQREREWARVSGILQETVDRGTRLELAALAEVTGDWSRYDRCFPGERKTRAERDLAWWIERPAYEPTQQVLDNLAQFGLTMPDRCVACEEYAVDTGEGRLCSHCQDYEGACPNDHCLTCGRTT